MLPKQYVSYFTVGWNSSGQLCPIPVLATLKKLEGLKIEGFLCETTHEAAQNRQCTLLLVSELMFKLDVMKGWFIVNGTIHAFEAENANDAIQAILSRRKEKQEKYYGAK